ncbi:MAG: hypothetical protein L0338_35860 [Acidobacteria bacterium]|nr:hypothetical protein [Acidobacteriota bacterium]
MTTSERLRVTVHYPAAGEPFKDEADRSETVGQLKGRVLEAFGLTEGQLPDGNVATYTLFHQKTPLENMAQTLGEIAGDQKVLQLKLSQQIVQGS